MKYYSTNKKVQPVTFKEAVIQGLPDDNGLFMPALIPSVDKIFIEDLPGKSLQEIGFEIARLFTGENISKEALKQIIAETLSFDIPVKHIHGNLHTLELFHGPTLAFKDVGARFLARCMSHFSDEKVTVLVATSGDTGSAVAHGFLGLDNVQVVILYPKGKVSTLQEKQFTTLGQNIQAIEVDGTFDDCQKLVKTAFLDMPLKKKVSLTSANSINVARFLPQSFYYFWAYAQLKSKLQDELYISVPSGNYGNLMAGLLTKAMGLPIDGFIASSNINDIVPQYLFSGNFKPKPSIQTISNAMDVGDPSNFSRILDLYKQDYLAITKDISGYSFTDKETRAAIKDVYEQHGYVLDPHGAVGYLGLSRHLKGKPNATGLFLETAHSAKFSETVEQLVGPIEIPERLNRFLEKEKKSIPMQNDYEELKGYLEGL